MASYASMPRALQEFSIEIRALAIPAIAAIFQKIFEKRGQNFLTSERKIFRKFWSKIQNFLDRRPPDRDQKIASDGSYRFAPLERVALTIDAILDRRSDCPPLATGNRNSGMVDTGKKIFGRHQTPKNFGKTKFLFF